MEFKYFGFLESSSFSTLSTGKQLELLRNHNLFKPVFTIKTKFKSNSNTPGMRSALLPLTPENIKFTPIEDVVKELYDYTRNRYASYWMAYPLSQLSQFKMEIFGLSEAQAKKNARKKFNYLFKSKIGKDSGITMDGFKYLYDTKKNLINKLSLKYEMITEFLMGNDDFFNDKLYENCTIIHELTEFESTLKILLDLNETYNLAHDSYFNQDELQNIFEEFKVDFKHNYRAFKFVHSTIEQFSENIPSHVESLYEFMVDKHLWNGKKSGFQKYLIVVHNLQIAKIRNYTNIINDEHTARVNVLQRKWDSYN